MSDVDRRIARRHAGAPKPVFEELKTPAEWQCELDAEPVGAVRTIGATTWLKVGATVWAQVVDCLPSETLAQDAAKALAAL